MLIERQTAAETNCCGENAEGVGQVKLTEGTEIDDFLFLMKNGSCESFQSQLKRDFTAVIFLRHLGCGMSQLDMLKYRDAYHFLKDPGIEIMMVIQGAEAAVSERTAKMKIPYTVIADPEQSLYEHFDIPSSDSMRNLVYGVSEEKLLEFEYYGIECQRFEGNELQLQATIVVGDVHHEPLIAAQVIQSHEQEPMLGVHTCEITAGASVKNSSAFDVGEGPRRRGTPSGPA